MTTWESKVKKKIIQDPSTIFELIPEEELKLFNAVEKERRKLYFQRDVILQKLPQHDREFLRSNFSLSADLHAILMNEIRPESYVDAIEHKHQPPHAEEYLKSCADGVFRKRFFKNFEKVRFDPFERSLDERMFFTREGLVNYKRSYLKDEGRRKNEPYPVFINRRKVMLWAWVGGKRVGRKVRVFVRAKLYNKLMSSRIIN
jgi:hypothetical protein